MSAAISLSLVTFLPAIVFVAFVLWRGEIIGRGRWTPGIGGGARYTVEQWQLAQVPSEPPVSRRAAGAAQRR
jgi:hypothetical protein